jgi:hypothetical protein
LNDEFLRVSGEFLDVVDNLALEGKDWAKKFDYKRTLAFLGKAAWICRELREDNAVVPEHDIANITNQVDQLSNYAQAVATFEFAAGQTTNDRLNINAQIEQQVAVLVDLTSKWTSISASERERDPAAGARESLGEIEALVRAAREARKNAQDAAEGASVAAQRSGAAAFTKLFSDEADRTGKLAWKWAIATAVLSVLTGIVVCLMVYVWPQGLVGDDLAAIVSGVLFRLVVLSLFAFGVRWCSRAALANFHLSTVHKHRSLGIQTLQAFQASPANQAAQDAVALEGARSVFEHVPTGYLTGGGSGRKDSPRMIDALRSLSSPNE